MVYRVIAYALLLALLGGILFLGQNPNMSPFSSGGEARAEEATVQQESPPPPTPSPDAVPDLKM